MKLRDLLDKDNRKLIRIELQKKYPYPLAFSKKILPYSRIIPNEIATTLEAYKDEPEYASIIILIAEVISEQFDIEIRLAIPLASQFFYKRQEKILENLNNPIPILKTNKPTRAHGKVNALDLYKEYLIRGFKFHHASFAKSIPLIEEYLTPAIRYVPNRYYIQGIPWLLAWPKAFSKENEAREQALKLLPKDYFKIIKTL